MATTPVTGAYAGNPPVLVHASELAALRQAARHLVLLDVRHDNDAPGAGRAAYRTGHIEDTVFVDLVSELSGTPAPLLGRRPLPAVHDLQRDARRWGIEAHSTVVVYDADSGLYAARAWWVLRWAGVADVRLLSGGLRAWRDSGGALTATIPLPEPGSVTLSDGHLPVLDTDGAARLPREGLLLDARDANAYDKGHIPHAIHLSTQGNLDATGAFADAATLRRRFAQGGVDGAYPIGVYCGGGIAAAHQVLALASVGIPAALYPGSWSAWIADPQRPVATRSAHG